MFLWAASPAQLYPFAQLLLYFICKPASACQLVSPCSASD